ncbi:MAG: hypothetical protein KAR39_09825 [Thermoplasmata archaeon]|nr:hypothetical protein [Thermoplasmata archaeon]
MEEALPVDQLMRKLSSKYNSDPADWTVLIGAPKGTHNDIFISTGKELWQVKVDSLYRSRPIGLGMKVGGEEEASKVIREEEPRYGLRPIPENMIRKFIDGAIGYEDMVPIVDKVLKSKPRRVADIESSAVLQGPVQFGSPAELSGKQRELNTKLNRSLDRLLFEKGVGKEYA